MYGEKKRHFYSWDKEAFNAWRKRDGGEPEFAKVIDPGADDMDPPVAKWDDGDEWAITCMTSLAVRTQQEIRKKPTKRPPPQVEMKAETD